MSQITAQLNYLRIAPRKVRALVDIVKGLDVDVAQAQLKYTTRRPAKPLLKLLNSAVSNAKHNLGLDENYLYIKEIIVNEGPKLKRYKPKGFGLPMPIQKKTSHIKIVLDELPENRKKKKEESLSKIKKVEPQKASQVPSAKIDETKKAKVEQKPGVKKEMAKGAKRGVFGGFKTLGRRLFRRKSI